jgi:hypothetical protein
LVPFSIPPSQVPSTTVHSLAKACAQRPRRGINLSVWFTQVYDQDYTGGFTVIVKQNGQTTADEITVKALDLTMPPALD